MTKMPYVWSCAFKRMREDLSKSLYRNIPRNIPSCLFLRNTNTGFIRRTDASGHCQKPALKMKTDGVGSRVPYWKEPCWRSKAWNFLKRLNVEILSSLSHNLLGFLPSSWELMHERFIELRENNRVQKGTVVTKLL